MTKTFTNRTTHVDTTKTITHIGLCAGYGGIELGLGRVIPTLRSVALCEIEAFPIANLVAKMEAGLMDPAPVWTDLKTFPWESFRDRVDILTGGYPCQPFSAAGKRAGKDDPRHLWPWIADGIRILRPRMCFFENVEGHISLGLSSVISDLEELGYQVSWGIFSAREVGAPHQRKRVFILAHRKDKDGRFFERKKTQDSKSSFGSSYGLCMADTNHQHGHGKERGGNTETQGVPSEHWQEEHSRWESGRADAAGHHAWPSRPGEPQHEWEPPRVVGTVPTKLADFCSRDSQSWRDTTQAGGESIGAWGQSQDAMSDCGSSLCGGDQGYESTPRVVGSRMANSNELRLEEHGLQHTDLSIGSSGGQNPEAMANSESKRTRQRSELCNEECGSGGTLPRELEQPDQAMGNATSQRPHRRTQDGLGFQPEVSGKGHEAMGNAEQFLLSATRKHGAMDEASGIPTDPEGRESAQTNPEPSAARKREGNWADAAECCETQPPLGGNADGSADWLVHAKLYTTCDNRTDELRLLGNGVVPATAERAFRTLLKDLTCHN